MKFGIDGKIWIQQQQVFLEPRYSLSGLSTVSLSVASTC